MNQSSIYLRIRNHTKLNLGVVIVLLTGIVGLLASFILTADKIKLLQNPDFVPACSLNPIISCMSAMSSHQSEVLGIPNSLFGIVLYTALVVSSALLVTGVLFPRVIWKIMLFFCLTGVIFVHYLIIQSLFVLHVICPWCLSIWLTTPLLFLALISEYRKHVDMKPYAFGQGLVAFIVKERMIIGALWYAAFIIVVGFLFREYWATLL